MNITGSYKTGRFQEGGMQRRRMLRYCATSRKVTSKFFIDVILAAAL